MRVDILERLADLIRPALSWREGAPAPKPDGAVDGRSFTVTGAMTSLTGASGEDFASILRSLGYRMDRRPKPAEPAEIKPAEPAETSRPSRPPKQRLRWRPFREAPPPKQRRRRSVSRKYGSADGRGSGSRSSRPHRRCPMPRCWRSAGEPPRRCCAGA